MHKIAVDSGHGYNTSGKRSAPFKKNIKNTYRGHTVIVNKGEQFREHVANTGVCFYLTEELERCGFEVFKSGWKTIDGTKDLTDDGITVRQSKIRDADCDISVSIHFNAFGDATSFNNAQGVETIFHSYVYKAFDGKTLSRAIQSELELCHPEQKSRGIKDSTSLGMCNSLGMRVDASCLVELAFMTNEKEAEYYFANPYAWYKYAVAIAKGICKYTNKKYVPYKPKAPITKESSKLDVAWLQDGLIRKGYDIEPDGVYGPLTAKSFTQYYKDKEWTIPNGFTGYYVGQGAINSLI